jgi:ribose 5-phosphate isomerase B
LFFGKMAAVRQSLTAHQAAKPQTRYCLRCLPHHQRVMYHRIANHSIKSESCKMKIAIASDHAGYDEKERLKPLLDELGIQYADLGTVSEESVDYPDYARKVGDEVATGRVDQGLLVCGSGTGMAIAANKVPGVRAAVAWNEETARLAREHNDANVLSLGARVTPVEELPRIVRAWFAAKFDGGRHARRVEKIREIEEEELAHHAVK